MQSATALPQTAPEIRCETLARHFERATALDGISITLPAGAFSVLLGPSGCGKSTLLRLIAGLDTPSAGTVRIDGRDMAGIAPVGRGLSMVFQSYALFPHLSVAENILFGLSVRRVSRAERAERLDRVAAMMGLTPLLARKPAALSGGQQQRVALARAVISERPICLMDEPLSNLDARLRAEMRVELRALQRRLGLTVVYVTHDQVEAMTMADRIVVLNQGRVEQVGPPEAIYQRPETAFVARFIGTPPMNLVPLHDLAGAELPPGLAPALLAGLRPEAIHPAEAGLAVRRIGQEFLGADILVTVAVGASRLVLRLPAGAPPVPEQFHIRWKPEALHLFDAATGRRHLPSRVSSPPRTYPERTDP